MAIPTQNNGSTFYNINECKSFKQTIGTQLEALADQPCSEVIIINRSPGNILVYDNGNSDISNGFLLSSGETFTFRGITNAMTVSAIAVTEGDIYYRTQYFSLLPQR